MDGMHTPEVVALRARFLFSADSAPLGGGYLTYDTATWRVLSVGPKTDAGRVVNLGNVAIVPGLWNAHTHQELSQFDAPLGDPTHGFPAWIREVVAWRREQWTSTTEDQRFAQRTSAVQRGLQESAACGVADISDIVSAGWNPSIAPGDGDLQLTPYHEVLGLRTNRINELFAGAQQFVEQFPSAGISPHAPYTVGIELLEKLVRLSSERRVPLAMHIAESPDELELLRSHSGAFYSLLTELDAWDPAAFPRGIRPREYLKLLSQASSALVIHGNYLDREEIELLAQHADRLTVVYCPRTHAYFHHPRYPLVEMLAKGVRVALGTDSRASNPDLNLWNELRYVADAFPELSLETIFRLALPQHVRWRTFRVYELPEEDAQDPYELLFDSRLSLAR